MPNTEALNYFYIITEDGKRIVWENLTPQQVGFMNRATKLHAPPNILKFGWGRMPKLNEARNASTD